MNKPVIFFTLAMFVFAVLFSLGNILYLKEYQLLIPLFVLTALSTPTVKELWNKLNY